MYLIVYDTLFGICHEIGPVFFTKASALALATQRATEPSDHHTRVGIARARFSIRDYLKFGWRGAWTRASDDTITWTHSLHLSDPHSPDCICFGCTDDPVDLYGDF